MSTRSDALQWFKSHYGQVVGPVYTSKFYTPAESWTKKRVWWFEIPVPIIQGGIGTNLHLLCQISPNNVAFHYLKLPISFLREQLEQLCIRDNDKISLFLSAEPKNLLVDERGKGKVGFSQFLVSTNNP